MLRFFFPRSEYLLPISSFLAKFELAKQELLSCSKWLSNKLMLNHSSDVLFPLVLVPKTVSFILIKNASGTFQQILGSGHFSPENIFSHRTALENCCHEI
ncbi:hypothetical protein FG379_003447 [Cryptosporidium bovis]|uniref:uncharacterized protein n=1 Tax=Cryptosporidium bovis TaxID=310047 RepID=UPI00351A0306|nr:hypothetical protein FG379_003447 [Cryptosporidium bovis]